MFSKAKNQRDTANPLAARDVASGVPSIVSPDLTVTGNLKSRGDVQVDGTVQGDVEAANLTVGETGAIKGKVNARTLRICGSIHGEVNAGSVTLAASGKVHGDVIHESLAIEAGAYVDGHCRRRDAAQHKPAETTTKEALGNSSTQKAPNGSGENSKAKAGEGEAKPLR